MTYEIVISGFGGQGVLTLGVLLSELALQQNLNVSWIPSYGAEMRGGTANCSVIISDKKIGSPIVNNIDILVAMNNPSIDKFIDSVVAGGKLVINDSIVDKDLSDTEFQVNKIPATDIAIKIGNEKVQNLVMLGKINQIINLFEAKDLEKILVEKFTGNKAKLISFNMQAYEQGFKN